MKRPERTMSLSNLWERVCEEQHRDRFPDQDFTFSRARSCPSSIKSCMDYPASPKPYISSTKSSVSVPCSPIKRATSCEVRLSCVHKIFCSFKTRSGVIQALDTFPLWYVTGIFCILQNITGSFQRILFSTPRSVLSSTRKNFLLSRRAIWSGGRTPIALTLDLDCDLDNLNDACISGHRSGLERALRVEVAKVLDLSVSDVLLDSVRVTSSGTTEVYLLLPIFHICSGMKTTVFDILAAFIARRRRCCLT